MGRQTNHNKLGIEEKRHLFNPDNVTLLEEFVVYLQSVGRSKGTIDGYINDIEMFFVYNLEKNKNKFFVDLTKKDIMFYQNYCMNVLKVESARYRRMRSSLSSLSNYIENMLDEEYPKFRNIINKIEAPPKKEAREKSIFEDDEIQALLDHLCNTGQYHKACCLALAISCGARKSELLRFKVNYFDDKNIIYGSLYKTPEKIVTKGKGGKMLYKYTLKDRFKPYFDLWMKNREELGIESEYLFAYKVKSGKEKQYSVSALDGWAEEFSAFLGKYYYWHACRHNWCTGLVKANIPSSVIKEIGGWESTAMVDIYTDIEIDDRLGDFFGEDGIKKVEKKNLGDL